MLIQQYRKRSQTINSLRPLIFFINSRIINSRIINSRIRKYNSLILKFLIYSITTSASSSSTA